MSSDAIILGNSPSSGSSLLATLLGTHADVYQTVELNIFDKPDWCMERVRDLKADWKIYTKKRYDVHYLWEHASLFNGFDEVPDYSGFDGSYAEFALAELRKLAKTSGCKNFVEKTPNNIFSIPALYDQLPHAKFVIIVRHPVSVYSSLLRRGYSKLQSVGRWYFANLIARRMAEKDRVLVVKYEELTATPYEEVANIFSFLGLRPPTRTAMENRESSSSLQLSSWRKDVRGPIKAQEVQNEIPPDMAKIFECLLANNYFYDYVGLKPERLSPMEVATYFGYYPHYDDSRRKGFARTLSPLSGYPRYVASAVYHGRQIRPLWHGWK